MVHARIGETALGRMQCIIDWWVHTRGFAFVPLPWLASTEALAHTRPPFVDPDGDRPVLEHHGGLVASGEQAFLDLDARGAPIPFKTA